ncbi:MAG: hypothetical protein IJX76_10115 [Clostridia bacterium]|nr:hypothetical protein [Clostridia bacterium]
MKKRLTMLISLVLISATTLPMILMGCSNQSTTESSSTGASTTTSPSPEDSSAATVTTTNPVTGAIAPTTTTEKPSGTTAPDKPSDTTATEGTEKPTDPVIPQPNTGEGVDLVLFIGQSNMAGRGTASAATKVQEGHAYEYRAISDPTKLYPLSEPFGVNENNASSGVTENKKTGSMVSAFCESYYAATGTPIVAVSCSKGGEKISFFDTSTKVYADAVSRVNSAKAFLQQEYDSGKTPFKLRNVFVVWLQGESDGDVGTTAAGYTNALDRIVKGFKKDIGAAQTFIIPIGTYNGSDGARKAKYNTIRDAQILYCEDSSDASVISLQTVDLHRYGYMKDEFHFKQEGYEILGKDAGANMAYFVKNGKKPVCRNYYENDETVRTNGAWQEKNGKVVIPASAAAELSTYASYSTANQNASWAKNTGGAFDGIKQTNSTGSNWPNITYAFFSAPQVHYTVHITKPGRYYLYLFTSYPDDAGNSVYASIDDGDLIECATADFGVGRWMKNESWYFDIGEAGDHTITIYAREDGVILNQIMLSQNKAEAVTNGKEQTVSTRGTYETHGIFKEIDGSVTIDLSTALENGKYAYSTTGKANNIAEPFVWERSAGYNGVQVYPDKGVQWATNNISPKLSYQVEFTTPGTYYVSLYSSFKDAAADSVFIAVNNGAIVTCMNNIAVGPGKWLGDTTWKITIPYAGVHTINIFPREDGAILHTLHLTQAYESVETLIIGDSYTGKTSWRLLDEQTASIGGSSVGISGTKVDLWLSNVNTLKIYDPENIVIHIGVNDINGGISGSTCGNNIVSLIQKLQTAFPDVKIFYVSICDNTANSGKWSEYKTSNDIVKAYADKTDGVYYIDFASQMKTEGPKMTDQGFRDGLHLNAEGYVLFSKVICDAVKKANQ